MTQGRRAGKSLRLDENYRPSRSNDHTAISFVASPPDQKTTPSPLRPATKRRHDRVQFLLNTKHAMLRLNLLSELPRFLFLFFVASLNAGTQRHDYPEEGYYNIGQNYDSVVRIRYLVSTPSGFSYSLGSGVLIDNSWILTAAHVVDGASSASTIDYSFDGITYTSGNVRSFHFPSAWSSQTSVFDGNDIALIRLEDPETGRSLPALYTSADEKNRAVDIIGFGFKGDGLTGGIDPDHPDYPPPYDDEKTGGTNILDLYGNEHPPILKFDWPTISDDLVATDFDRPNWLLNTSGSSEPVPFEFCTQRGDSGGPWFTSVGATKYVVAVTSFGINPYENGFDVAASYILGISAQDRNYFSNGKYLHMSYGTRISKFHDWISETVRQNLAPPDSVTATELSNSVRITWAPTFFADDYLVQRSSDSSFSNIATVGTTSNTEITDSNPSSGINYYRVISRALSVQSIESGLTLIDLGSAPPPQPSFNIALSISPNNVPVDGQSLAVITATVTSNDSPVSGVFVSFERAIFNYDGAFTDASGNTLTGPNNGNTDASGKRVTYYRPSTLGQTCQFTAYVSGDSDTASFNAVGDTGASVVLAIDLSSRDGSSATYAIEADAISSSGAPIREGTMRFTATHGTFISGDGAPSTTVTREISNYGYANVSLRVTSDATGTITAEFVEGGASSSQNVVFSISTPPTINHSFTLTAPEGGQMPMIASGTNYLTALAVGNGLVVWDMNDLSVVRYWDENDFSSSQDGWASADEAIAISRDDQWVVVASAGSSNGRVGIFRVSNPGANYVKEDWAYFAGEDIDIHPTGINWIAATDEGSSDDVEGYNMSGGRILTFEDFASASVVGVAYSPDGSRISYSVRDRSYEVSHTDLVIRSASTGSLIARITMTDGQSPNGVSWSPDSQHIAVGDGSSVRLFNKNGGSPSLPFSQLNTVQNPGAVSWCQSGEYIAVHMENDAGVSIFSTSTGVEVARCAAPGGNYRDTDTIAWRSDGEMLFATYSGSSTISVFIPFDGNAPDLTLVSPAPNFKTDAQSVQLTGTITDDIWLGNTPLLVSVNGGASVPVSVDSSGAFSEAIALQTGNNIIALLGADAKGNSVSVSRTVLSTFDPTPPQVSSYSPLGDKVPLDTAAVTVSFNKNMTTDVTFDDGDSPSAIFELVEVSTDTVISSAEEWSVSGSDATLTLSSSLRPLTVYAIRVSRNAQSLFGVSLDGNVNGTGGNNDDDWEARFTTVDLPQVASPTISPTTTSFVGLANLSFSTATSGATIRYTTDGTEPTAASDPVTNLVLYGNTVLKLRAFKSSYRDSSVTSALIVVAPYTVTFAAGENGSLSGDDFQSVTHGDSCTPVEGVPNPGYRFSQWTDGSLANPRSIGPVSSDASVTAIFVVNSTDAFNAWLRSNSMTGDISRIGPDGDFDNDFRSNFFEYAFVLDATTPFNENPTELSVHRDSGNTYARLAFRVRSDDTELTYRAHVSGDLSMWTPITISFSEGEWSSSDESRLVVESASSNSDGTWNLVIEDKTPVTPGSPRFIRLEVDSAY